MSNQLEFIMQMYMMNLLQQQQQQQQLQQQQHQLHQSSALPTTSPAKCTELDISSSSTVISSSQHQHPQQQTAQTPTPQQQQSSHQQHNSRTQLRKNSQNTNCSSSSSCSPNSNSSCITNNIPPTHPLPNPIQQLLLEQLALPPAPHSNVLLTPPTPNSTLAAKSLSLAAAAYASSQLSLNPLTSPLLFGSKFSAGNFLQSSTVTSTPTTTNTTADNGTTHTDGKWNGGHMRDFFKAEREQVIEMDEGENGLSTQKEIDDFDEDNEEDEEAEEEKPLSSLLQGTSSSLTSGSASMSAGSSSNTTNAEKVQTLESTLDSSDSTNLPYKTPTKQPADSTHCTRQRLQNEQDTSIAISSSSNSDAGITRTESTNTTPLPSASAILTPPASEPLTAKPKRSNSSTRLQAESAISTASSLISLSVASSLDAFLQNEENLKNLRKFSSYLECENVLCRQENLREHFHCFDVPCQGKILSKKDDIIRHLKWHKKRKESLLLGFARFSAADDCEPEYGAGCAYNWKQTHYHCVYEDCPKVYVSTSDVQMHANFHRKNSEIVQEGFRRFRAHENCKIEDCPFYGKKTSHYHCCREGCNHTFKNKADMDKHKTYHLKDYQLTQDGFKKILKTETCPFEGCKFSTVCNHIHCVREGCNYILHSSSQMISHKRKHDRADGEQAYQHYKQQKDSSDGDESPAPTSSTVAAASTPAPAGTVIPAAFSHTSTPLSSLSADRFLARKRGRPPKKIQLPAKVEGKRPKLESDKVQSIVDASNLASSTALNSNASLPSSMFPAFLPNFNAAAAAAAAQSMQSQDPNAPNLQLTHLMALFQLQNPLFYQNLYPNGMTANMASLLGAAAAAGVMPAGNTAMLGNLAAFGAAAAAIKTEFNEKQTFKE